MGKTSIWNRSGGLSRVVALLAAVMLALGMAAAFNTSAIQRAHADDYTAGTIQTQAVVESATLTVEEATSLETGEVYVITSADSSYALSKNSAGGDAFLASKGVTVNSGVMTFGSPDDALLCQWTASGDDTESYLLATSTADRYLSAAYYSENVLITETAADNPIKWKWDNSALSSSYYHVAFASEESGETNVFLAADNADTSTKLWKVTGAPKTNISDTYKINVDNLWGYTGSDLSDTIKSGVSVQLKDDKNTTLKKDTDYTVSFKNESGEGEDVAPKDEGTYTIVVTGIGSYAGTLTAKIKVITYFTVYEQVGNADRTEVKTYTVEEFNKLAASSADSVSALFFKGGAWKVLTATKYVKLDTLLDDAGIISDWKSGSTITYGGDSKQGKSSNSLAYDTIAEAKFFPEAAGTSCATDNAAVSPFVFALEMKEGTTSTDVNASDATTTATASTGGAPRVVVGTTEADYLAGPTNTNNNATSAGKRLWSNVTSITIFLPMDATTAKVVPEKDSYVFTGKALEPAVTVTLGNQPLTKDTDYTVEYANNTNAGTGKAIVTFKGAYTGTAEATFQITPLASTISLANQTKTFNGKAQAYSGKVTKSGSAGAVSYKYYSDANCTKEVSAANVKNAGTYYVKATVAASGNYAAATSAAAKLTINKAAQPMTFAKATKTVKLSKVKKAKQTVAINKAKKAQGKVTYAISKVSKSKKNFSINKSTGKITVKKGTSKGTYKVTVKATAKGNANYKSGTKKAVITIKVK